MNLVKPALVWKEKYISSFCILLVDVDIEIQKNEVNTV